MFANDFDMSMWVAAEPTAMSYSGECILLVRFKAVGSLGCHPLLMSFLIAYNGNNKPSF